MTTNSTQQQIAVVAGLRRALAKIRHHAQFTRRVKPILEARVAGLHGHLPDVLAVHLGERCFPAHSFGCVDQ
jgi:hypothetical protein